MRSGGRARPCAAGFTLIEVIGAVLLLSIALLMVIQLSGSMGTQLERSAVRSQLTSLARESIDSLETLPFDSLDVGSGSDTVTVRGRSYTRSWTVSIHGPLLKTIQVDVDPVSGSGPGYSATSYSSGEW